MMQPEDQDDEIVHVRVNERDLSSLRERGITNPSGGTLPPDLIEDAGEVRVLDVTLAARLGFVEPRMVRKLIKRHAASLEAIGGLVSRVTNPGPRGGRPGSAFYLTEGQATFIVAKAETAFANSELVHIVQVFTEFRRGNLIAKDTDTQTQLDAYQAEREVRRARHLEEKEARSTALRFLRRH